MNAVEEVNHEICRMVVGMWNEGVTGGLDDVLLPVDPPIAHGSVVLTRKWQTTVNDLMTWLDWSVWIKCRPAYGFEEMCYLPTWPFDGGVLLNPTPCDRNLNVVECLADALPLFFHLPPRISHLSLNLADNVPRANTCTTVASGGVTLHPPHVITPPSPLTPLSESSVTRDPLPHLPPRPKAPAASSPRPKAPAKSLNIELSPAAIHGWLGRCKDTFESWQAMNPDKTKTAHTLITLASLKMEESTAVTWWNENREKLKKLGSWEEFAQEVMDQFIPSNWCMLALATFYSIHQGLSSFADFAKTLQIACNALAGAGQNWTISDAVLKNHLLFFSHPVLRLSTHSLLRCPRRGIACSQKVLSKWLVFPQPPTPLVIPNVPAVLSSLSDPSFIGIVQSLYVQLAAVTIAERHPRAPARSSIVATPVLATLCSAFPSRASPAVIAAVGPVGFSSAYEEGYQAVAVVMPAYNAEEDD
ncbi:hypothetical protein B0H14DRAFT_3448956 [Mycena olivaceomarginata]|nr:hypothetical protein B0H14DRAFT_3448956 [Mycena olivaceomarginata]